ncbi:MAG: response regulator [Bdellovibrionaceae bacterium]|nr:response regulator [Pseudobdellovibrionaceae bacterium]MDW8190932.1 response regulator [Pseudobdellovibrionaceae bacterium]
MFPADTRFLVVDDFATMRKIVKKVLNELGYSQIEEADDGKPALELLKNALSSGRPFGVVISDWNMPGMTGIELLKSCRQDPKLATLPFILVTAESEQKNILEAAKSGVSDYIVKPFNAVTLKTKLERVYQRHHTSNKVAS